MRALLGVFLLGCSANLNPVGEFVTCATRKDCPADMDCQLGNHLCVPQGTSDTVAPVVLKATATDATHVTIDFSEVVVDTNATYAIVPDLTIIDAHLSSNGATVTLVTAAQFPTQPYRVTIGGVVDRAGNALSEGQVDFVGFGMLLDTTPPRLVSAMVLDNQRIDLLFSEAMLVSSSTTFVITPTLTVSTVAQSTDGRTLTLITSSQTANQLYTIKVSGITDQAHNAIMPGFDAATVTGFGMANDAMPPLLQAPSYGAVVKASSPLSLSWSAPFGATDYHVQVSTAADFSNIVVDQHTSLTTLMGPGLQSAVTYYWRVASDVPPKTFSMTGQFDAIDKRIYVHCPDGLPPCNDQFMVGNLSKPMQTIAGGLARAKLYDLQTVWVASRPIGAYQEAVTLVDGIDLLGGYVYDSVAQSFSSAPSGRTAVQSTGLAAMSALHIVNGTILSGFSLSGGFGDVSYGLYVQDSNLALTVTGNSISSGLGGLRAAGVYMQCANPEPMATALLLQGNDIHALAASQAQGAESSGVRSVACSARLYDNVITADTVTAPSGDGTFASNGVSFNNANVELLGNTIIAGKGVNAGTGAPAMFSTGAYFWQSSCVLSNNVVVARATGEAAGVRTLAGFPLPSNVCTLDYNTVAIIASASGGFLAPADVRVLETDCPMALTNNLLVTDASGVSGLRTLLDARAPSGSVSTLHNNAFVAPGAAELATVAGVCTACTDAPCVATCSADAAANVVVAGQALVQFQSWTDSTSIDLHLHSGVALPDPVRSGGTVLSGVTGDHDHNPRTCSGPNCTSIGAYEQDL